MGRGRKCRRPCSAGWLAILSPYGRETLNIDRQATGENVSISLATHSQQYRELDSRLAGDYDFFRDIVRTEFCVNSCLDSGSAENWFLIFEKMNCTFSKCVSLSLPPLLVETYSMLDLKQTAEIIALLL